MHRVLSVVTVLACLAGCVCPPSTCIAQQSFSYPDLVKRMVGLERLAEFGYGTVQTVTTANETLVFALPREIRPPRS